MRYMVEGFIVEGGFNFLDYFEDVGFSVGITIGSDSEMNLLIGIVFLEGNVGSEDGIWGCHFDVGDLG